MKTAGRIFTIAVPALCLIACTEFEPVIPTKAEDSVTVDFMVSDSGMLTKADGDDGKINNVKLLVFDSEERLILYKSERSSGVRNVELPGKTKLYLYAVVNSPADFSSVTTLDQFLSMRSYYRHNTRNNLVMVGHKETSLTKSGTVVIPVKRIAAQIQICSIESTVPACSNIDDHSVEMLFLDNVAKDYPYSMGVAEPTSYVSAYQDDIHAGIVEVPVIVPEYKRSNGRVYKLNDQLIQLYCYPNYLTKCNTGLVLRFWGQSVEEVEYKHYVNTTCHHFISFKLPVLESNKLYRISKLVIDVDSYGSSESKYSSYKISATCHMDSFDVSSGLKCESFNLVGEHYEENIENR